MKRREKAKKARTRSVTPTRGDKDDPLKDTGNSKVNSKVDSKEKDRGMDKERSKEKEKDDEDVEMEDDVLPKDWSFDAHFTDPNYHAKKMVFLLFINRGASVSTP